MTKKDNHECETSEREKAERDELRDKVDRFFGSLNTGVVKITDACLFCIAKQIVINKSLTTEQKKTFVVDILRNFTKYMNYCLNSDEKIKEEWSKNPKSEDF